MNVLFLCKRYYTNKDLLRDQFGRLFHLPVQLARLGATVSVACLDYRSSSELVEEIEGVEFQAVPATIFRLPGLAVRLREVVRRHRPHVIIASGDSHIGYLGCRLGRAIGAKFVFDIYDYYPAFRGNRIPGMRSMFRSAVRHADVVLCASVPLKERLAAASKRAVLIENGVDRGLFAPMDRNASREGHGLPLGVPLVGYFGSITPARGPLLFEAVRGLRDEIPGIRILLAGKVSGTEISDPAIIYVGEVAQAEIPSLVAACDVVTLPYARDEFNEMAGPCKIAEYLACERPVVATRIAGHEAFFSSAPGSLCEPDAQDFALALKRQLATPEVAIFPEHLDWPRIAQSLYGELAALGNQAA